MKQLSDTPIYAMRNNRLFKNELVRNDIGDSLLRQIVDILLLNGTLTDCPGLIRGKMGITIFFFHYARYTGNKLFEDYAMELIGEIQDQIHNNTTADYESGIAGIGVGFDYLLRQGFLDASDDVFEDFDQRMYRAVMYDPWFGFSLYNGLTGYGHYWICRICRSKRTEYYGPAKEALLRILDLVEKKFRSNDKNDWDDIYCFLCEMNRAKILPDYTENIIVQC